MRATPVVLTLLDFEVASFRDALSARRFALRVAQDVGIAQDDATRLATAVCEIARQAQRHGTARVHFVVERQSGSGQLLIARITSNAAAMHDVDVTLSEGGVALSQTDDAIAAAMQIVAHFRVLRAQSGEAVFEVGHPLPASAQLLDLRDVARIVTVLPKRGDVDPLAEAEQQHLELVRALGTQRRSETQIEHLNSELEATNRGVMALYAELDDRAEDLKRVSEHKSRFLSDVSHELRTPMTSVLNLTRLLLDHADGPLTGEQERQVALIRHSVQTVTELVNDLLDIARIEAGHSTLRYRRFTVGELFAALRGICRPLLTTDAVGLVFDDAESDTELDTDDARVAQILRNLLSNAIKFTERGEIRVSASIEVGDLIRFDVRDTGIGIAPADQERVFDEFTQIDSHLQRRAHGSGLGLRLSRNLATLLGGRIELVSTPGRGSTFSVLIPRHHPGRPAQSLPNGLPQHEVTVQ